MNKSDSAHPAGHSNGQTNVTVPIYLTRSKSVPSLEYLVFLLNIYLFPLAPGTDNDKRKEIPRVRTINYSLISI